MGADNISIIAVLPAKIPKRTWQKAERVLKAVRVVMDAIEASDVRDTLLSANEDGKWHDEKKFAELLATFVTENDVKTTKQTLLRVMYAYRWAKEASEDLESPGEDLLDDLDGLQGFRDAATRTVTLDGKKWDVLSAGERTWGDEPSGAAYQTLKIAYRWGFIEMLGGT